MLALEPFHHATHRTPPKLSFEVFPPKTDQGIAALCRYIDQLASVGPDYISVTYGAGGSTKANSRAIVEYIKTKTSIPPAPHLTCVGASKEEVNQIALDYKAMGVERIVAIRGDMPGIEGKYTPHSGGYAYADDMVRGLRGLHDFELHVAAYPEVHPEALSEEADLEQLKRKQDYGAAAAITQYCFDTELVLRFIDKARTAGVTLPIIPGIIMMNGFEQLKGFSKRCGATVPGWLDTLCEGIDDHEAIRDHISVLLAYEQCRLLMQEGIEHFHIYTLNKAENTLALCRLLGVK